MAAVEKLVPLKKEKEILTAVDSQIKELNQIFKEQARCLDERAVTQLTVLELAHDFMRKWADIENEHASRLEKLVKSFVNKEKSGNNGNVSISACLLGLFSTCGKLGKMYQSLADTISQQVVDRLQVARDESQTVRKQCAPVLDQCQESVRRTCLEIMSSVKPYNTASSSFFSADQQWHDAHVEASKASKSESRPQFKKQASAERKLAERTAKRDGMLAKVNDERNKHLLSLSNANAAMHCYNTEILPKYIRAMDYCARPALCQALMTISKYMSERAESAVIGAADELKSSVTRCQAENDVALMAHYAPKLFVLRPRSSHHAIFRFKPLRTDEPGDLVMPNGVRDNRKLAISNMNTENSKKLAAIVADLERWEQAKWSPNGQLMADSGLGLGHQPTVTMGTIENYAQTLKQYSEIADQISRNEHELTLLTASISSGQGLYQPGCHNSSFSSPLRSNLVSAASTDSGRPSNEHLISSSSVGSSSSGDQILAPGPAASRTPVFGGSIEDHLNRVGLNDSTNLRSNSVTPGSASVNSLSSVGSGGGRPVIPPVVICCVSYLTKFGLKQQGVFRINGSQIEISDIKSKFERCENPLAAVDGPASVNAAASVLKSYFRQLREPLLLPSSAVTFQEWLAVQNNQYGMAEAIGHLVSKLPSQIRSVAAFLFVFLNRVSEHSGENMMDAYNLAVCFAPCLLPCPNEADQMQHFNALAGIIKVMILNANSIFSPEDVRLYDDIINGTNKEDPVRHQHKLRKGSLTSDTPESGEISTPATSLTRQIRTLGKIDHVPHSPVSTRSALGDSLLPDDAEAMFNFTARNGHELTLKRGDRMRVVRKLSDQWWEVTMQGRSGLVPANYLRLLNSQSPSVRAMANGSYLSVIRTRSSASQSGGKEDGSVSQPALLKREGSGKSIPRDERRILGNETNDIVSSRPPLNVHGSLESHGSNTLWLRRQNGDQISNSQNYHRDSLARRSDPAVMLNTAMVADAATNIKAPTAKATVTSAQLSS